MICGASIGALTGSFIPDRRQLNDGALSHPVVNGDAREGDDAAPRGDKIRHQGLRKNTTIELYLAGCDDEMVKAVTGHFRFEMRKK